MDHISTISWGVRLAATVGNNGIISVGTVGSLVCLEEFSLHAADLMPQGAAAMQSSPAQGAASHLLQHFLSLDTQQFPGKIG